MVTVASYGRRHMRLDCEVTKSLTSSGLTRIASAGWIIGCQIFAKIAKRDLRYCKNCESSKNCVAL